jgi:hypothetical protein
MLVKQKERKKLQQPFKQTVVSTGEGRRRRRRREKVVVRKWCCGNCTKLAHHPSPFICGFLCSFKKIIATIAVAHWLATNYSFHTHTDGHKSVVENMMSLE